MYKTPLPQHNFTTTSFPIHLRLSQFSILAILNSVLCTITLLVDFVLLHTLLLPSKMPLPASRASSWQDAVEKGGTKPHKEWAVHDQTDGNVLDRHELILLGPGEKKIEEEVDTRKLMAIEIGRHITELIRYVGVPNACIFTFNKEDHTLGNLLRSRLLEDPHVLFSGYKVGRLANNGYITANSS